MAFLEAAVAARDTTIAERDEQLRRERAEAALRIHRLQLQIDRFNRKAFGRSSEKLGQMLLDPKISRPRSPPARPRPSYPSSPTPTRSARCRCASSIRTCRARGWFASRPAHAARAAAALCAPWAKIAMRCSIWSPRPGS
ncbi:MAG: hypothetical protein EOS35_27880 [Mesorhizobium sp.]|nr:MAG: hypothetical protein EOS35_27880 [Mesorhizobium sp.]